MEQSAEQYDVLANIKDLETNDTKQRLDENILYGQIIRSSGSAYLESSTLGPPALSCECWLKAPKVTGQKRIAPSVHDCIYGGWIYRWMKLNGEG